MVCYFGDLPPVSLSITTYDFRQIAQLMGVNETNVSRRIRRLIKRISDGGYITCLRNRAKFSREELDIAREYFVLGWSMKRIARERAMTFYRVRKMVDKIRGLLGAIEKGRLVK